MESVKMKFALAFCLSIGFALVGPVSAQSINRPPDLSATVDGVRGRCGLGLLARTSSSQSCQGFKDYGARMHCVADDLSNDVSVKYAPGLGSVAQCYRRLGDALIAGRGADSDQINALEDVCRTLRYEPLVQRLPLARDLLVLASDALMPGFSRTVVGLPPGDPMRGVRLQDMPDCGLAMAVPPGPPAVAASAGSGRAPRAANGASTSAIPPVRIVSLGPTPGVDVTQPASGAAGVGLEDIQSAGSDRLPPLAGAKPSANAEGVAGNPALGKAGDLGADKAAVGAADRAGAKVKGRSAVAELGSPIPISESAVINALPSASASNRRLSKRTVVRSDSSPSGYGLTASDLPGRTLPRTSAVSKSDSEARPGARVSDPGPPISGYSAASPPSLPLTGPPLRPRNADSVR